MEAGLNMLLAPPIVHSGTAEAATDRDRLAEAATDRDRFVDLT